MLINSSMLNYKLSMSAKLWGNITVREGHVNRLSAHNKYKHRSLYTCRTDFEDIREDFNE